MPSVKHYVEVALRIPGFFLEWGSFFSDFHHEKTFRGKFSILHVKASQNAKKNAWNFERAQ